MYQMGYSAVVIHVLPLIVMPVVVVRAYLIELEVSAESFDQGS